MTQYTTRAGQIRTGTFDVRGRETQTTWSDTTPAITRTFDAAGRLLTLVNSASAIGFGYDAANQLASETTTLPGQPARTIGYTYDVDGNRAAMTSPAGSVIQYAYTGRNQVGSITADGGPALATYTYDLAGRRIGRTLENNTATTYQYDAASRLTGVIHTAGPNVLASYIYTLNTVGDRTSRAAFHQLGDSICQRSAFSKGSRAPFRESRDRSLQGLLDLFPGKGRMWHGNFHETERLISPRRGARFHC